MICSPSLGQGPDEGGQVNAADSSPILGADRHGRLVANDALTPITGHVFVHAHSKRIEQRRFSVEPAADDGCDPPADACACDPGAIRLLKFNPQRRRRLPGNRVRLEGAIIDTTVSGQPAAVGDEGHQVVIGQLPAQSIPVGGAGRQLL